MRSSSEGKTCLVRRAALIALICSVASAASAQTAEKPPEAAPVKPEVKTPTLGPTGREIKLAEDTWFRFAVQIQAWAQLHQDRILQPDGSDGTYGFDMYCRRCRFFVTGSVVKNVFFNFLFEAAPGRADATTGVKAAATPQVLDAYGQVKFADAFWLSAGNILMPFSRNGTQPTTTYLSLDVANITTTPVLQGNSYVIRDLGIQANGFFLANHLEYRIGIFQGSRQAGTATQSAGHNGPRLVTSLAYNLWDTETGYVNGGHYYGAKKVLGVMANWDYQSFRKNAPPAPGVDKNAYMGMHGSVFINYPLSGQASPKGGDEVAAVAEVGYYNGGFEQSSAGATTNAGTYPNVLKQLNFLGEAAYYNHAGRFSVFGKFEMRKIDDSYVAALKAASNQTWIAGGAKYYLGPANMMYLALQYERAINGDAPSTQQGGVNNITFAWQTILY